MLYSLTALEIIEMQEKDKAWYECLEDLRLLVRLIAEVADHICYLGCKLAVARLVAAGDQSFSYGNRSYSSK